MAKQRDLQARVKLVGAMLRLDEFTAKDLAEAARVDYETTRTFLKDHKEEASFAMRSGPLRKQGSSASGRRPILYKLAPEKRSRAIELLAEFRAVAAPLGENYPERSGGSRGDREMTLIALLENSVNAIEESEGDAERTRAISQARAYADGAIRNLTRIQIDGGELRSKLKHVSDLLARIHSFETAPDGASEHTEEELVGNEASAKPGHAANEERPVKVAWQRLIRVIDGEHRYSNILKHLVGRHGTWLSKGKGGIGYPCVMLLDGIAGNDQISSAIAESYAKVDAPLARLDIASASKDERLRIFATIDWLRASTPLALSDVCVTVDTAEPFGKELAIQVKDLGRNGFWRACYSRQSSTTLNELAGANLDGLRSTILRECAVIVSAPEDDHPESELERVYASRLQTALSGRAVYNVPHSDACAAYVKFGRLRGDDWHQSEGRKLKLNWVRFIQKANAGSRSKGQRTPISDRYFGLASCRMAAAAYEAMGKIVCYDLSSNSKVAEGYAESFAEYCPIKGAQELTLPGAVVAKLSSANDQL